MYSTSCSIWPIFSRSVIWPSSPSTFSTSGMDGGRGGGGGRGGRAGPGGDGGGGGGAAGRLLHERHAGRRRPKQPLHFRRQGRGAPPDGNHAVRLVRQRHPRGRWACRAGRAPCLQAQGARPPQGAVRPGARRLALRPLRVLELSALEGVLAVQGWGQGRRGDGCCRGRRRGGGSGAAHAAAAAATLFARAAAAKEHARRGHGARAVRREHVGPRHGHETLRGWQKQAADGGDHWSPSVDRAV
mmetsp:Transcript_30789/g.96761  ORF Transcript_30789/g.96761 Transcript_30789/m.96761 type:complete len:243 (-) Transcript_30789:10-738(-)